VLRQALGRRGLPTGVADLSVGAVGLAGQTVMTREYLSRAPAPALFVLCIAADSPFATESKDPSAWVGNEAVIEVWSRPGDLFVHYPDFPRRRFDSGLRFLAARTNSFQTYGSLVWQRVQIAQDRLAGGREKAVNRFGGVEDMARMGADWQRSGERAFARPDGDDDWPLNPWFDVLRRELVRRGMTLVVVEMPMPEYFRRSVTRGAGARRFRAWLADRLRRDGGGFIDWSDPDWIADGDFDDAVHLNPAAAVRVAERLADALRPFGPGR
jgi:hypothetical protein